jgi:hypothetical protein
MAANDPNGRNKWNKTRPVGADVTFLSDNEGTDAQGRQSQVVRDEYPTRVDEVTDSLIYLGWAELGATVDDPRWKIRRIQQVGSVWEQKYAGGEEVYRFRWDQRSMLNYE